MTWPEAVDQALCFGCIDRVRKPIDETSYANRFTPGKARSTWSTVNFRRVQELSTEGRTRPGGLRAFAARTDAKSATDSYEKGGAVEVADDERHSGPTRPRGIASRLRRPYTARRPSGGLSVLKRKKRYGNAWPRLLRTPPRGARSHFWLVRRRGRRARSKGKTAWQV